MTATHVWLKHRYAGAPTHDQAGAERAGADHRQTPARPWRSHAAEWTGVWSLYSLAFEATRRVVSAGLASPAAVPLWAAINGLHQARHNKKTAEAAQSPTPRWMVGKSVFEWFNVWSLYTGALALTQALGAGPLAGVFAVPLRGAVMGTRFWLQSDPPLRQWLRKHRPTIETFRTGQRHVTRRIGTAFSWLARRPSVAFAGVGVGVAAAALTGGSLPLVAAGLSLLAAGEGHRWRQARQTAQADLDRRITRAPATPRPTAVLHPAALPPASHGPSRTLPRIPALAAGSPVARIGAAVGPDLRTGPQP